MAETREKHAGGRPRKSLHLLKVLGAINVTRHRERLTGEIAPPPKPKQSPELEAWSVT